MLKSALTALAFCSAVGTALAQSQTPGFIPPPRTIADITAILDQEKPDPQALVRLWAAADALPPAGADRGVSITIARRPD
jgi:hypothetical protein